MSKTLCELKKHLKQDFDTYVLLVCQPRFVCKDCGRAANRKKYLCNPKKIEASGVLGPELEMLPDSDDLIPLSELPMVN
jgi:hypothetical protein